MYTFVLFFMPFILVICCFCSIFSFCVIMLFELYFVISQIRFLFVNFFLHMFIHLFVCFYHLLLYKLILSFFDFSPFIFLFCLMFLNEKNCTTIYSNNSCFFFTHKFSSVYKFIILFFNLQSPPFLLSVYSDAFVLSVVCQFFCVAILPAFGERGTNILVCNNSNHYIARFPPSLLKNPNICGENKYRFCVNCSTVHDSN